MILYHVLINVAEELECPLWCKVEMSAAVNTRHHDQPRSERQTRLQDQIGAGGAHLFGFSFEGSIFAIYSATAAPAALSCEAC